MEIEIREYLKDELKRLNRMNDLLEKDINTGKLNVEPEQIVNIVNNVKAMCEIAITLNEIRNY